MVHRIVCSRQIVKYCTGKHTSLVTIFDVLSQIKHLYVWHNRSIEIFGITESFHSFKMTIILYCL